MNIYNRFAVLAQSQPGKAAIETRTNRLTYGQLDLLIRRYAAALREAGVEAGTVVGVRLQESPEYIALFFALMRLGAVLLPVDWRTTRQEFEKVASRFQPHAFVTWEETALQWHTNSLSPGTLSMAAPDEHRPASLVDAPFIYGLTSGTTGEPKATAVSHEQLLARYFNRALEDMFRPDDRFLNTLALAFTAGREHAICALLAGATLGLIPIFFDAAELVAFVTEKSITVVNLSPNMSRALIQHARPAGTMLMPGLRALVSTTGKLQPEEREAIRRFVAPRLIDYYGATAVGMIAVLNRVADHSDPSAVGLPAAGIEIEIADSSGKPLSTGEVGRIRLRGPALATPISDLAETGEEGFGDGWFYPGDLGSIAPDGVLHLSGRAADLIKRGGIMVHAQEVEQALRRHESVADAAVVGAPSPSLGQEVVAFVVQSQPVDQKDLVRALRKQLAPYKIPSRFIVVDSFPRNANGKVVKAELLKQLQAGP
jgi:acyl-coenzyme A synthetase/AMP-(fatty) acid ligase